MGRLHTCYAPVRRSPPMYCYIVLPLDLHVLSLPLAFILSQDQTLHCIFFYNVCSSCYSFFYSFFGINALLFIVLLKLYFFFQYVNELFLFPPSLPKGAAKIERILELQKIFQ